MLDPKHNKTPHSDLDTWFNENADQDKALYLACGLPLNDFCNLRKVFRSIWLSTKPSHSQNLSTAFIRYCANTHRLNSDKARTAALNTNSTDIRKMIDRPFSEEALDWSMSEEDLKSLGWKTEK